MEKVDLNCDMGESTHLHPYNIETDLQLLKWVSSINLACGFHAGDPHTMHQLVEAALEQGVAVGVHPSFADRENFGRKNLTLSPAQIYDLVVYQLGSLHAFLHVYGTRIHHLKPHGALYNMATADRMIADAICHAIKEFDPDILLYGLSGSELMHAAKEEGLTGVSEIFADRTYQPDGTLTSRKENHALVTDRQEMLSRSLEMIRNGKVKATNDQFIPVTAGTICLHSDQEDVVSTARFLHESLTKENVIISQP